MLALNNTLALHQQNLMTELDRRDTVLKNMTFSSPGLVIGLSAAAKVKIANTTVYSSNGVFCSKSTAEVAFTATTHNIPAVLASIQEACFLLTLAADGTATLTMGAIASGAGTAVWPERPATGTPIGGVRIAVVAAAPGSGTNFVAATTALDDARLSAVTYYNWSVFAPRFDAAQ